MSTPSFYEEIESQLGTGPNRSADLRRVAFMKAASYLIELMSGDSTILPNELPAELIRTPSYETSVFETDVLNDLCQIINTGIKVYKRHLVHQIGPFEFDAIATLPDLEEDVE